MLEIRKRMGSGDSPGLQNRRAAGSPVAGGFDSHSLPPSSGSFAALRISPAGSRFAHARKDGSTSKPVGGRFPVVGGFDSHSLPPSSGSFAALRISPAGSRFAHARKDGSTSKPAAVPCRWWVRLPLASAIVGFRIHLPILLGQTYAHPFAKNAKGWGTLE
jgi:hypothetical protein